MKVRPSFARGWIRARGHGLAAPWPEIPTKVDRSNRYFIVYARNRKTLLFLPRKGRGREENLLWDILSPEMKNRVVAGIKVRSPRDESRKLNRLIQFNHRKYKILFPAYSFNFSVRLVRFAHDIYSTRSDISLLPRTCEGKRARLKDGATTRKKPKKGCEHWYYYRAVFLDNPYVG